MLREHLPPIDAYLADAASMDREGFLERYPWPWFVVPEPTADILSRIQRPETVIAQAQTQAIEMPHPASLRGASLDALCLELRSRYDRTPGSITVRIGRSVDADVVLLDESVSRLHAELRCTYQRGESTIVDLGAKNGTWVGERRLQPHVDAPLASSDVVRMGSLVVRYHDPAGFFDWLQEGAPRSGAAPGRWPT
jgi:hypothetical protein